MITISRPKFLRISSAVLGTAAAGSAVVQATSGRAAGSAAPATGIRTVLTFCDICFWKCRAIATVRDGEFWKVEGNPLDPPSRGSLCPRGSGG